MIAQLALLAVLAAPSLTRLQAAGGGLITIQASRFSYSLPNHRVEYTGDPVRLVRGDATLTCRKLTVLFNQAEQVSKATCEEQVRFERGDKVITCQKATYEDAASRLTCEGSPEVKAGGMTATGALLVYDLGQDQVTMTEVEAQVPSDQADAKVREFQSKRKSKPGEGTP